MKRITFDHDESRGSFSAYSDAERWCKNNGYSTGSMQRGAPTLIYYGDCDVAKFRNISAEERRSSIGAIIGVGGRFRDGPVTVEIKDGYRPEDWPSTGRHSP